MFQDAAAMYVGLGWKVFPLGHGSKLPAIKGGKGFKDATDDADVIDAWVKKFPKANIAISTGEPSGIVVIDVDPRNGGNDSLSLHAGSGRLLPRCPTAKTGNNGRHFFYQHPTGLKPSKDRLGKGIDVKSTGGYVVAAPSWIAATEQGPGGYYEWLISPETIAPPPLPNWVLDILRPKAKPLPQFEPCMTNEVAQRSLEGMAKRLAGAGQGTRNDLLNWAAYRAGILVRDGKLGASLVDQRLTQAALASGLPLPEIKATIASGMKGALAG